MLLQIIYQITNHNKQNQANTKYITDKNEHLAIIRVYFCYYQKKFVKNMAFKFESLHTLYFQHDHDPPGSVKIQRDHDLNGSLYVVGYLNCSKIQTLMLYKMYHLYI